MTSRWHLGVCHELIRVYIVSYRALTVTTFKNSVANMSGIDGDDRRGDRAAIPQIGAQCYDLLNSPISLIAQEHFNNLYHKS